MTTHVAGTSSRLLKADGGQVSDDQLGRLITLMRQVIYEELDRDAKFASDVEYVDDLGPLHDARILLATRGQVLGRCGVSAPREVHMVPFLGSTAASGDDAVASTGGAADARLAEVHRAEAA